MGHKSLLEALISDNFGHTTTDRRALIREFTDAFITAADRYGSKEKEHFDLLYTRFANHVDHKLQNYLRLVLKKAEVPQETIENIFNGRKQMLGSILRRSTSQLVPDLVSRITDQTAFAFNVQPSRLGEKETSLHDGGRFTLPSAITHQVYLFVHHSYLNHVKNSPYSDLTSLLEQASLKLEERIVSEAQENARNEVITTRKAVSDKERRNALDEDYFLELLMTNSRTELILALGVIFNINNATVQRILNDPTWEPLAVVCRASNVSRVMFANLVNSMNKRSSDESSADRIVNLYNTIPAEVSERTMRFFRVRADSLGKSIYEVEDDHTSESTGLLESA